MSALEKVKNMNVQEILDQIKESGISNYGLHSLPLADCIAQAKEDKQTGKRPEILNLPQDIDQYDEIYLGYPNYWGTMPMAVYTFLESYDFTGKKIHPFCTHEGSGLSNTESDIKKSAKGAVTEKGIAIHGSSVDQAKDVLERWIQK